MSFTAHTTNWLGTWLKRTIPAPTKRKRSPDGSGTRRTATNFDGDVIDGDSDNQVVPWSSSAPPLTAASSSGNEWSVSRCNDNDNSNNDN
ncbi:hypothetical protein SESBI_10591 [Sesbania bispinosa]|nr:hypothetical protein SESBI_10591 [Sesbania bispinosa]